MPFVASTEANCSSWPVARCPRHRASQKGADNSQDSRAARRVAQVSQLLEYTDWRPRLLGEELLGEIKRKIKTEENRTAVRCTRGLRRRRPDSRVCGTRDRSLGLFRPNTVDEHIKLDAHIIEAGGGGSIRKARRCGGRSLSSNPVAPTQNNTKSRPWLQSSLFVESELPVTHRFLSPSCRLFLPPG